MFPSAVAVNTWASTDGVFTENSCKLCFIETIQKQIIEKTAQKTT